MPSTQSFTDILDIQNDLILTKTGTASLVLEVAAINFGLFSEKEQEATIYAYAQLLNSLSFSVQIVISSRRKDISDYIAKVDQYLAKTDSPKVREQMVKYREFVRSIVRQTNVLDKSFYVVISYGGGFDIGLATNILPTRRQNQPQIDPVALAEKAAVNLAPKRDHLIRLLARIGLRSRQLTGSELLQVLFDFYNPESLGTKVSLPASQS